MIYLVFICFIQSFLSVQTSSSIPSRPADVLQSALKAVESIESVEYEVRSERSNSAGNKFRGRTTILASRSPFRFSAKLQGEDALITQIAVSDGKITRASYNGKTDEANTFAPSYPKERVMPARPGNDVIPDVSATWRLLLNPDFLKEAIASGNIVYVKQEDVEGDLCNVVLYVRNSDVFESVTEYYWFSAKTGLPRAVQRLTLMRGSTNLRPRFTISKIKLNPSIPADAFSYRPVASDSSTVPMPKTSATVPPAGRSLIGNQLPDLEVRDREFKPLKLTNFSGKLTLINFWATWCGPCIEELPVLQKMQDNHKGELQVVAIAVRDSRLNVLKFIKENPQYKFVFLTDPDMQESVSRLDSFFRVEGIPVSVFVDAQGKVVDHWFGFKEGEQALIKRVQQLIRRYRDG
ncbi:MAG: redoxin family protein [Acidobacteriota bacterium]|nr:redoxin family protein [Acidobacteriota bacterium]